MPASREDRRRRAGDAPATGQGEHRYDFVQSIRLDAPGPPEGARGAKVGEITLGTHGDVIRIGDDFAVIHTGGYDLHVPLDKFRDDKGHIDLKLGDSVSLPVGQRATVVKYATVPLEEKVTLQEKRDVERAMRNLSPFILSLTRQRRRELSATVLREFVSDLAPNRIDVEAAQLHANALQWIFEGTDWMTASEVAYLAAVSIASVNRWKKKREVFAISHQGRDLYPKYAFDPKWRPLAAVAEILAILADSSPESLAAWFESTSSFLAGQRPRELVATQPARVVAAAENTVLDEQYAG